MGAPGLVRHRCRHRDRYAQHLAVGQLLALGQGEMAGRQVVGGVVELHPSLGSSAAQSDWALGHGGESGSRWRANRRRRLAYDGSARRAARLVPGRDGIADCRGSGVGVAGRA